MKKRFRVFPILFCMMFFVCACTRQDATGASSASPSTAASVTSVATKEASSAAASSAQAAGSQKTEESGQEETDAVNVPSEDIRFIRCVNTPMREENADPRDPARRVSMTYDLPQISAQEGQADADTKTLAWKMETLAGQWKEARDARYMEHYRAMQETRNRYLYSLRQDVRVMRADTRVFACILESADTLETEAGKTETSYTCSSLVMDGETAKDIAFSDVVKDGERLAEIAAEYVIEKYDTSNPAFNASDQFDGVDLAARIGALFEEETESGSFAWAPAYLGIRLVFARKALTSPEGLSSYLETVRELDRKALQTIEITVPYTDAPEIFEARFTALPVDYIARLEPGVTYLADLGNGQETLRVSAPRKYEDQTVLYTGEFIIQRGEARESFRAVGMESYVNYGVCAYLVVRGADRFLYLDAVGADGTDRLHVYAPEGDTWRFVGVSDEMLDNDRMPPGDPSHFLTEGYFLILPDPYGLIPEAGVRGCRFCAVSPGGMPVSGDAFYLITDRDERVTKIELSLDTLPEEDALIPVKETYPAGTGLTLFRVEPASHADLRTADGRVVRLYINGVDTIDLIDGHELHDAFADPRQGS